MTTATRTRSVSAILQEVSFTNDVVDALGELAADELKYVQMSVIVKWSYAHRTLYGYDKAKRRVSTLFHEPWVDEGTNHLEWDPKFTLVAFENVRTAFKVPGQWFLDVTGGKVLYRPLAGENPETLDAYAPQHGLSSLVELRGDPANGKYVENVEFRNVSFEHASFDVCLGEEGGSHQIAQFQAASTDGGTIHAVRTYAYGGSGLYCDEGTEGVILERNVVWNTTDSNFYEHFGEGNIVRNNIFAWNREYASIRFYRIQSMVCRVRSTSSTTSS